MSSSPPADGRVRSRAEELAEELNRRIRALWTGPGGHPTLPLSGERRAEYHRLLAELDRVERGDVTTAA